MSGGRVPGGGGAEVQFAHLARGLVRRGFDVRVVTCDFGQPREEIVDGVRLLRAWPPNAGLPVVRFFHPRLSHAAEALGRAAADVYVFKGGGMWTGFTYDLARARGAGFVFVTAHDLDVTRGMPAVHGWRDRTWYARALRGADRIVVQTRTQQRLLEENYGRPSTVIMNHVEIPREQAAPAHSRRVVWVGTYKPGKRPEWFTRLAERHPDLECLMVGNLPPPPLTDAAYREALAVADRTPNLRVLVDTPHERIGELLRDAALFVHTSPAEGFPNTLLEAWSWGLPAVTCFDPDGILERERLGERHDGFEAWEGAVLTWMADPARREAAGARARDYTAHAHGSGEIHDRYAGLFDEVIAARRRA